MFAHRRVCERVHTRDRDGARARARARVWAHVRAVRGGMCGETGMRVLARARMQAGRQAFACARVHTRSGKMESVLCVALITTSDPTTMPLGVLTGQSSLYQSLQRSTPRPSQIAYEILRI